MRSDCKFNNLYTAFVEVLSARQTLLYTKTSVAGLDVLLQKTQLLYEKDIGSRADVNEVKTQRQIAEVGVLDAEENLRKAKRTLGTMLNFPPDQAESFDVRGSIYDKGPPPPSLDEMVCIALECRPDAAAYRLGLQTAESGSAPGQGQSLSGRLCALPAVHVSEQRPFRQAECATSWAVGMTIPVPIWNHNQGNIERARQNVTQSHIELEGVQRTIVTEVRQTAREYQVSGEIVERIRTRILPTSRSSVNDRLTLFQGGETNVVTFLQAQRNYNDNVKAYHDTVVRHRRSMLGPKYRAGAADLAVKEKRVKDEQERDGFRIAEYVPFVVELAYRQSFRECSLSRFGQPSWGCPVNR